MFACVTQHFVCENRDLRQTMDFLIALFFGREKVTTEYWEKTIMFGRFVNDGMSYGLLGWTKTESFCSF